jgi:hypothetical protein
MWPTTRLVGGQTSNAYTLMFIAIMFDITEADLKTLSGVHGAGLRRNKHGKGKLNRIAGSS